MTIDTRTRPAKQEDAATIVVGSDRLRMLPDGPRVKPALIALIDGAQRELRLLFYIFEGDKSGTEVRDALIAAARRGVAVELAVDDFGSSGTDDEFFRPLVDAGCGFCRFHPRWGRRYLLRNHQKMAIADRRVAIIGGFNIADIYFDMALEDSFRDLGLRIEGPAAEHLAVYHERLLEWINRKRPSLRAVRRLLSTLTQTEGDTRWIFGGPSRKVSPYARELRADMRRTRDLQMIMAYFAPSRSWLQLLGGIARRGSAVLITAGKSDVPVARYAAWATYGSLLRRRVQIAEYRPRALHAKLIIMDDVVYIGSGNFDMRSLYLNLEVMLRIENATFAQSMRDLFARELERSEPIDADDYARHATWFNRLIWRLSYWLFVGADFAMSKTLTSR
ncbi:MAG: phosphatidylserine/phosphatidylglycerophosphate/cardiolipin synthase family protein [Sphingomonadaceae bacterium]|nr:phosphatidylserine/phosphatidylglycerophosphate/cardiolipin synthase family protein [Sphingomonadaceae bacterium]